MAKHIDLNADIGEASTAEWAASEAAILAYISSANIACGGHAGNEETMQTTVNGARENDVSIGAHPSYPDRKNFGRLELSLGEDIEPHQLSESLYTQICRLMDIAKGEVKYVKPHGALYNQAVKNTPLAALIGDVILRVDPKLLWLGGPNSQMMHAAHERGLTFVKAGHVTTRSGQVLSISPGSLCVHGDSAGAVETARAAHAALEAEGLTIRAFS